MLYLMVGNVWLPLVWGFNMSVSLEVFCSSVFDSINTECLFMNYSPRGTCTACVHILFLTTNETNSEYHDDQHHHYVNDSNAIVPDLRPK